MNKPDNLLTLSHPKPNHGTREKRSRDDLLNRFDERGKGGKLQAIPSTCGNAGQYAHPTD